MLTYSPTRSHAPWAPCHMGKIGLRMLAPYREERKELPGFIWLLASFANQIPGICPRDYSTAKRYNWDLRVMQNALRECREAIKDAARVGVTNADLMQAAEGQALALEMSANCSYRVTFTPRQGQNYRRTTALVIRKAVALRIAEEKAEGRVV